MSGKLYFEEHGEQLLKSCGISKAEFARRMGICKQNVNSIFSTKSVIVLRKVAQVLDVPFELLISYSKEPKYEGCVIYSDLLVKAKYIRIILPYFRGDKLFTLMDDKGEIPIEIKSYKLPLYDETNRQFDFIVDIADSRVYDWSYESSFRLRAKVCDSGTYILLDRGRNPILQISGYVPDEIIPPLEYSWGDYVEFDITSDGKIANWPKTPDLMEFAERGEFPKPVKTNKWQRAKEMLYTIKSARLEKEELEWIKNHIL